MKKTVLFLVVFAGFAVFFSACDSTSATNPYQGWTMTLSHTPEGNTISKSSNPSVIFITAMKDSKDNAQTVTNISWILPPDSNATDIRPYFYPAVPGSYNVMQMSTTFATPGDVISVTAEFSGIQSSCTITFVS